MNTPLHTQILASDGDEPIQVASLYAVESHVDDTLGWVLECRVDERGYGAPLLWYTEQAADEWVKRGCKESGCYGDQRVVRFDLAAQLHPLVRCDCCAKWGHAEADCANDDHDHTCVNDEQAAGA